MGNDASSSVSTMIVFKTLLAMALFGERPTAAQWLLLAFVCAMVMGLRLTS